MADTTVCAGNVVVLSATAPNLVNWYTSAMASSPVATGMNWITPVITGNTVFYAQTSDSLCASNKISVEVNVYNGSLVPVILGDTTVCGTDSLWLFTNPLPGVTYTWITPDNTLTGTQYSSSPGNITEGIYLLFAYDDYCTSDTAAVEVSVHALPEASITNSPFSSCQEDWVTLSASYEPLNSYSWSTPGGTLLSGNPAIFQVQLADSGMIVLTVTSPTGCINTDTVQAHVKPLPVMSFSINDVLCVGQTIYFNQSTPAPATGYIFGPNGYMTTLDNDSIVNASTTQSGIYTFVAILNGCADSLDQMVSVVAYPFVSLGPDTTICAGGEIVFDLPTDYDYNWFNGSSDNELSTGTGGWVWVTASLGPGCAVTDSVWIEIENCDVAMVNIFTPNGDGINDEFTVAGSGITNLDMRIYNRYGNELFATTDPEGKWNGYDRQGNAFSTGVYFYVATVENELGKKTVLHGHFQLNR